MFRTRRDDHQTGPPPPDDDATEAAARHRLAAWTGQPGPDRLTAWRNRQGQSALSLLLARAGHPDAVGRAAVVLRSAPGAPEAEQRYGLRAWPAETVRCDDCGRHHGPAAVCRECGARWNITVEEPLYDHRPEPGHDPGTPRDGLCFACGVAGASLPEPRHALPAGPPCEADDDQPEPEPAAEAEPAAAGDGPAGTCGCPVRDGSTYHDRDTCTDPLVGELDWYADTGRAEIHADPGPAIPADPDPADVPEPEPAPPKRRPAVSRSAGGMRPRPAGKGKATVDG